MGMQGPLTAQALGRSPYDDTVEWDADVDGYAPEISQQYDHRGRPVNSETKRFNRDIIRSHNEVMLVIGVAEPEFPTTGPEVESETRRKEYEESVGTIFSFAAFRCVEIVGMVGLHGLRQRILVYNRYSKVPFWDLLRQSRQNFSIARDVLAGVPASLVSNYYDRYLTTLWSGRVDRLFAKKLVNEVWSYVRVHLELFAATQRLGLISSSLWLPPMSYFIPFTEASPIPSPPPLQDFSFRSVLQWVGGVFVSATPFLVWVMTQRLLRDWRPQFWNFIYYRLPSTYVPRKRLPAPPAGGGEQLEGEARSRPEPGQGRATNNEVSPLRDVDGLADPGPVEAVRRPSTFSAREDDYATDEEGSGEVSATLISFDVEATEATEAAPGLWSAELRPSIALDARNASSRAPVYDDTVLTRLPTIIASAVFGEAASRLAIAPYEATALRLVARAIHLQRGLSSAGIYPISLFRGLSWTSVINFLGVEFFHLLISGEIWAVASGAAVGFHLSEEEWRLNEQDALGS